MQGPSQGVQPTVGIHLDRGSGQTRSQGSDEDLGAGARATPPALVGSDSVHYSCVSLPCGVGCCAPTIPQDFVQGEGIQWLR